MPGVRRHLLVVLAGLGEWDLVSGLAASDADTDVRATGLRMLTRCRRPQDREVVLVLLAAGETEVLETAANVAREISLMCPEFEPIELAAHPNPRIRAAFCRSCARSPEWTEVEWIKAWYLAVLQRDGPDLGTELAGLCDAFGSRNVFGWTWAESEPSSPSMRASYLDALLLCEDQDAIADILESEHRRETHAHLQRRLTDGTRRPSERLLLAALPGLAHWVEGREWVAPELRRLAALHVLAQRLGWMRFYETEDASGEIEVWLDSYDNEPATPDSLASWASELVEHFETGARAAAAIHVASGAPASLADQTRVVLGVLKSEIHHVCEHWGRHLSQTTIDALRVRMDAALAGVESAVSRQAEDRA